MVEFVDDGFTDTNSDRPGFNDMMAMIRRRELHCVIVKDLPRILSKEAFIKRKAQRQELIDDEQRRISELKATLDSMDKEAKEIAEQSQQNRVVDQLREFNPSVIRKLVKRIRVYGEGKVEIDIIADDSFSQRILEQTNAQFNGEVPPEESSAIQFVRPNQSGRVKTGSKL